ncbi:MAG: GAF domain-containing protein, partial [Anaerolineales bacterium]|nr:GAF domain-containing protein [Anaerolineales bacterium]
VMRTGRPLRQSIFSGQGIKLKTDDFARSVLCVPLKLRGMTVGVLSVSNLTAMRSFSKQDEFLLAFLADYAAIALENARVFQAADQALAARLEELNTLIEITRTITSSINLKEVVQLTINQVHDSWNITASSLWLLDEARGVLKVLANVGTPEEVLGKIEVPLNRGIVGNVAQTGKWIVTNDAPTHPLHYHQVDNVTGFQTESILCVPLLSRGKVIGALQLLNKQDGDFDDQDVERALSIAAAVAIAVANALLFNESESRKQQLEVTLEHNKNPILITDVDDNLHLLNHEARTRLHLTADAVGKPVTTIIQQQTLSDLLTTPIDAPPEELVLSDGTIWLPQIAAIPEHGRILILQDITELRELDQAKDLFLATVSHDMRDPLNTINGFATSLADIGPLNEKQTQHVERIVQATSQMMDLVNDLLELTRISTQNEPTKQLCNMVEIVTEVIQTHEASASAKEISLLLTSANDIYAVLGDPKQLRRAISNLVDNAIKFSPKAHPVHVTINNQKQVVTISVRDQGKGISANDLPHIFDKFYRGRHVNGLSNGTGLGLALVRSIAEAHDGQITVHLHKDAGSEFVLALPATQAS